MRIEAKHDRLVDLKAEEFSLAIVHAIVAAGGGSLSIDGPISDANGVDCKIAKEDAEGIAISDVIRVQVKSFRPATFRIDSEDGTFPYDLKAVNYNRLCKARVSSALVLVRIPPDTKAWVVSSSHSHLVLSHSVYWTTLRGLNPLLSSVSKKRLRVPSENLLLPETLDDFVHRVNEEYRL